MATTTQNHREAFHNVVGGQPTAGPASGGTKLYLYGQFRQPPETPSTVAYFQLRFDGDNHFVVPAYFEAEHQHIYCHTPAHPPAAGVSIEIKSQGETVWTMTPVTFDFVDEYDQYRESPAVTLPQVDTPASG